MPEQRFRNFIFTHNNYDGFELEDSIECKYIAYSEEVAPETGTPHLQGFVCFKDARTKSSVIKKMPGCHIIVMHGSINQNEEYCSKSGTLIERGDKPLTNENQGRAQALRFKVAWDQSKQGDVEAIDADIRMRYYNTIKSISMDYMIKPENLPDVCGIWIYGATDVGKTHCVVTKYPGRYIKGANKQWNGYQGEDVVHMDEVNPEMKSWIGHFLLKWADKYPFDADIKYGGRQLRPKKFIITSNFSIDEMFFPYQIIDAIKRRFKEQEKKTREQIMDFGE